MILEKEIDMVCCQSNKKILNKIFTEKLIIGKHYNFSVNELTKGSGYEINVKCDFCDFIRKISYSQYIINTQKDDKYYCKKCSVIKQKETKKNLYDNENYNNIEANRQTCLKKYGVSNVFKNEDIKNKSTNTKILKYNDKNYTNRESYKQTCLIKYGVDNVSKNEKIQIKKTNTCLKNWGVEYHFQYNRNKKDTLPEFNLYRYNCYNLTLKNKKELLNKWNGFDYYDNEYIKNNFNLFYQDKNYPTIDHKISIYYGFRHKLSIQDISSIDNLCLTKRTINSKKNIKTEKEFSVCYLIPVELKPPSPLSVCESSETTSKSILL
jgi:hypothetical protein